MPATYLHSQFSFRELCHCGVFVPGLLGRKANQPQLNTMKLKLLILAIASAAIFPSCTTVVDPDPVTTEATTTTTTAASNPYTGTTTQRRTTTTTQY
jgi:hypothetical protein